MNKDEAIGFFGRYVTDAMRLQRHSPEGARKRARVMTRMLAVLLVRLYRDKQELSDALDEMSQLLYERAAQDDTPKVRR